MSEPRIGTGNRRQARCSACLLFVLEVETIGAYGSGAAWSVSSHDAPCGLPCWGGGVPPRAYRTKQFHRINDECPRCSTEAP